MDENENVVAEETEDIFDGWDDEETAFDSEDGAEDEQPEPEEEDEEEEETEGTAEPEESGETEEPETDQSEGEEEPKEDGGNEQEQKEEKAEEPPVPESFKLKHLGEEKEYSRDEVTTLAQKGLDYDRIRTERDALKADAPKYKDHEAFLAEIAESAGVTVDKMIEDIRTRALVERESKAGRPLTETAAREQIQREMAARTKSATKAEEETKPEEPEKPATDERDARKRAEIQKFAIAHPDVKGQDIPPDVWQAFHDTDSSLEELYTSKVLYPKVLKELEAIKAKTAEKEQNDRNAARSTGSRKSAGKAKAKDPFYDGWDD